jgi:hypothetical protein
VEIRADRDAAALVGGVDDAVEALGGVGPDGQEPDAVEVGFAPSTARGCRRTFTWPPARNIRP